MCSKKKGAAVYRESKNVVHPAMRAESQISSAPPTYEQAIGKPHLDTQATPIGMSNLTSVNSTSSFSTASVTKESSYEPTDTDILTQALKFTHVPPPATTQHLRLPIAIPQSQPGLGSFYTRLFAPSITSTHSITESDFLAFIDNYNLMASPAPSLQVVGAVGGIIGFLPLHLLRAVGSGIQAGAQMGGAALSAGRAKLYLQKANEDFFAPRQLRVRVVNAQELAEVLQLPSATPGVGRLTPDSMHQSSLERRVAAVRPYMTDVTFDVPPPTKQTDMLKRMAAKQVAMRSKKAERQIMRGRSKQRWREERGFGEQRKEDRETRAARKVKWILIENL